MRIHIFSYLSISHIFHPFSYILNVARNIKYEAFSFFIFIAGTCQTLKNEKWNDFIKILTLSSSQLSAVEEFYDSWCNEKYKISWRLIDSTFATCYWEHISSENFAENEFEIESDVNFYFLLSLVPVYFLNKHSKFINSLSYCRTQIKLFTFKIDQLFLFEDFFLLDAI